MSTGAVDLSDLKKLTVVQLKGELENRNLPTTGTKAVLIERLQADIDAHPASSAPAAAALASTAKSSVSPTPAAASATTAAPATNGTAKPAQPTTAVTTQPAAATTSSSPALGSAAPMPIPATASEQDKIAARAARFGVDTKAQLDAKKAAADAKKSTAGKSSLDGALSAGRSDQKAAGAAVPAKRTASDAGKLTVAEDAEKIAARAKRFATDTPDAVKPKIPVEAVKQSAEEQERLKKRAEKFGTAA